MSVEVDIDGIMEMIKRDNIKPPEREPTFYRPVFKDRTYLHFTKLTKKQKYYIKKYGLETRVDSDGNTVVFGDLNDINCPVCNLPVEHPLLYEKHLKYSKCEDCGKKLPMHYLFELGGIPGCGCYCYDCTFKIDCYFNEAEWRKCGLECPLCMHGEYCKHSTHPLHEIFKCDLCKDYI